MHISYDNNPAFILFISEKQKKNVRYNGTYNFLIKSFKKTLAKFINYTNRYTGIYMQCACYRDLKYCYYRKIKRIFRTYNKLACCTFVRMQVSRYSFPY